MKRVIVFLCFPCLVYGKPVPQLTEEQCLSLAIYKESSLEPLVGKQAVASVVLTRARLKSKSVCQVVFEKHQFSWTRKWKKNKQDTLHYLGMAKNILAQHKKKKYNVLHATHFHSKKMKRKPKWTRNMKVVAKYGNHLFYI